MIYILLFIGRKAMEISMKKLLILDSNSIINRGFYGVRFLSTKDGTPTNAIYGFLSILSKLITEQKPDYVCAAFDLKAPTFRHKLYADYKAQRKPMPDELKVQMPIAKDIVRAMNIPLLELEGYEADDIIGTVSRICEANDIECLIATGDKDDLQLATDKTKVVLTVTRQGQNETVIYDADAVKEKYKVTPTEFIDVKALMGDPSDNIPGVKGIGEKTATDLISKFGSIEYIYDHIEETELKGATLKKITEGKEMAFFSKTLATIDTNVPIEFNISDCEFSTMREQASPELYTLLKSLELNSIIRRFDLETSDLPENPINDIFENVNVERPDKYRKISGNAALIVGLDKDIQYIALAQDKNAYVWDKSTCSDAELKDILKQIAEDEDIAKICFDVKSLIVAFNKKIEFKNILDDVVLKAYLIDPSKSSYEIANLCNEYFGIEIVKHEKNQLSLFEDEETDNTEFLGKSAIALLKLNDLFNERLKEMNQLHLYHDVEMPLLYVLAAMQSYGFLVDAKELESFSEMLGKKIFDLTDAIYKEAGEEFNINSPKQLGVILFDKLGLPRSKKTKSGYSTNAEVLEKLRFTHPIIELILDYRQYSKLKSTYCDGLRALINPDTKRIHSIFNQTVTVTGRISSTEPNMQNIPTRTELGRELRKMFVAQDGYVLVDADYSQIELRVLAHIAHDETMINAFKNNEDIHSVTASQVFDTPLSEVTPEQRRKAKAINFGIVYGMGEFSLAQDLGISIAEAKRYIQSYLAKYSGVGEYMDGIKKKAAKEGSVKTLLNRVRFIPEISSSNHNIRAFGERVALNTPIQGTAADIIKLAMVRVYNRLKENDLKSRLILQVHDELIVEAKEDEVDLVKQILKEEMENAMELDVPLTVDMSTGHSWYEAK